MSGHEYGALYQAHLATNVRRLGVDAATAAARITAIPRLGADGVSKPTMNGTVATRNTRRGSGQGDSVLSCLTDRL